MRTENGFGVSQWNATTLTATTTPSIMCPAAFTTAITVLSNNGLYATVTATAHGLFDGESASITGASDSNWNGYFVMKVVNANTLSYTMAGVPANATLGTAAVSTFKVQACLVLADAGNGDTASIGPDVNATSRPLSAGQEYNIPQVDSAYTQKLKVDLATWYMKANSSTQTLRLLWIMVMAMCFFFCDSALAQYGGVQKAIAGANITITPSTGVGVVTISSTGGGGGSSFPLTSNVSGGGFSITNASFVGNGNGLTNLSLSQFSTVGTNGLTIINTNFVSGQLYTNNFTYPIIVQGNVSFTVAAIIGVAYMDFNIAGINTNRVGSSSSLTSIGMTYPDLDGGYVPVGGVYTFTNQSTGAGNSSTVSNGQIAYISQVLVATNFAGNGAGLTNLNLSTSSNIRTNFPLSISGTNWVMDCSLGGGSDIFFTNTATGNGFLIITNLVANQCKKITLYNNQDGTGGRSLTFITNLTNQKFVAPNHVFPVATTNANAKDMFTFTTDYSGTNLIVSQEPNNL